MKKITSKGNALPTQSIQDERDGGPLVGLLDGAGVAAKPPLRPSSAAKALEAGDLAVRFADFGSAKDAPEAFVWTEAPGVMTSGGALLATSPRFVVAGGRSGLGKSFFLEYVAEQALEAKMPVMLADFDRDNASMTARFGKDKVVRPDNASDAFFEEGLKKLHDFQKELRCDVLVDIGFGSVRTFCAVAKRIRLQAIQEQNGIRPVLTIPLGLKNDDLMVVEKFNGAYLPRDILLVLNAALVPFGKDPSLEFESVLSDPRIVGLLEREARSMMMPALPAGDAFQNTKRPFSWAPRLDWNNPLREFEVAEAEEFLRDMRASCEKHADILPFPRRPSAS